jgi:hypothetical protein
MGKEGTMNQDEAKYLIVRRLDDHTEVDRVRVQNVRTVERVMLGMLANMDLDVYYIDDAAFEDQEAL